MKIRTQSISRVEGAFLEIDLEISQEMLPIAFEGYVFTDQLTLKGKLVNEGKHLFRLGATLHAQIEGACARCLKPVQTDLNIEINESFVPSGHENHERVSQQMEDAQAPEESMYVYQDHIIDLEQAIRDNIVLSLPQRLVCSSQCKGLCPKCGQNLNQKQCDCSVDSPDETGQSPFDRLKELL